MPDVNTSPTTPLSPENAPAAVEAAPVGDTIQLVDRQGQVHDVPRAQAGKAVASGQFGWVHGTTVPIVDPSTGLVHQIASHEASNVLSAPGHRLASAREAAEQEREEKYGGIGGAAIAGGEGLARGLSAGLSDPAAVGLAGLIGGEHAAAITREHLSNFKEANPGISMTGEIAGAVAPMLFGDEAGIANILGSIPRGIDGAGELASVVARRLVGTGAEGLLGKTLQKAIPAAAKAMVEGGLWSAGQEISSATLENRGLVAENVLSAIGHGALLAGAIGGGLAAAEPLAGKVWEKISDHLPASIGEGLEKVADEQYIRALSPNKKGLIAEMKDRFGGEEGVSRIANRLRSEGIVAAGDDIEAIAGKAAKAEENAIAGLTDTVDKVGAKGVKLADVVGRLEKRAQEFDSQLGYAPAAAQVRNKMAEIMNIYREPLLEAGKEAASTFEIPLADLLKQRRGLEGTINWNTDTVVAQGVKAAGRTIEDSIMNAGEEAAKEAGNKSWRAEYEAAKKRFAETRFINEVAADSVNARLRNRAFSPSDYAASLMGSHTGSILGAAGGHALGGGIMGLATGALHHVVRERGNATAAVLLDKLGTMTGLSEMHADAMGRLDGVIVAGLRAGKKTAAHAIHNYSDERFERESTRVSELAAAPGAVGKHLAAQTATIAGNAPEIASAVQQKSQAALSYLASKIPQEAANPLTPHVKMPLSKSQKIEWLQAHDAIEKGPEVMVKKALAGHATVAEIDAIKSVYPEYFAEAQQRVLAACADKKHPVPYQQALRLGILFSMPTDASLTPESMQVQQQMYAASGAKNATATSGGKRGSTQKPLKSIASVNSMFSAHEENK